LPGLKAIGVRSFIQQGALVELLSEWSGESFPLYALYPSGHLPAAKVRAFIDFIQSRVAGADGMADEGSGRWHSHVSARSSRQPAQGSLRSLMTTSCLTFGNFGTIECTRSTNSSLTSSVDAPAWSIV
jgi:hypothetical protein